MSPTPPLTLRLYRPGDDSVLAALFTESVHGLGAQAYNPAELAAWAPKDYNPADWEGRFAKSWTLLAEDAEGTLLGFIELEEMDQITGNVEMLFVTSDHPRQGIAKMLYLALEKEARGRGYSQLIATASLISRPFFLSQGFNVLRQRMAPGKSSMLAVFDVQKALSATK